MKKSRKKKSINIQCKCHWCGTNTNIFVVNADRKTFCLHGYIGHEPTKDCMSEYLRYKTSIKNA